MTVRNAAWPLTLYPVPDADAIEAAGGSQRIPSPFGVGHGSVYFEPERGTHPGRWVAKWKADGKWVYKRLATQAEAIKWLGRAQGLGDDPAAMTMTVGAWLAQRLEEVVKKNQRPQTFLAYEKVVRLHLSPGLGATPLPSLRAADVQRLLDAKLATISGSHVRLAKGILQAALQEAFRRGLVQANPISNGAVKLALGYRSVPELWSVGQGDAFLASLAGRPHEALFTVALCSGLRRGELLGLTWADWRGGDAARPPALAGQVRPDQDAGGRAGRPHVRPRRGRARPASGGLGRGDRRGRPPRPRLPGPPRAAARRPRRAEGLARRGPSRRAAPHPVPRFPSAGDHPMGPLRGAAEGRGDLGRARQHPGDGRRLRGGRGDRLYAVRGPGQVLGRAVRPRRGASARGGAGFAPQLVYRATLSMKA